jgi:NAD(P)-dependent dehydrogenase (short-subunit alcohol dehydrogenase family)
MEYHNAEINLQYPVEAAPRAAPCGHAADVGCGSSTSKMQDIILGELKMKTFTGKIVLITGAGKGTGRRVAEAFAGQGASVAVNDVSPVNLDATMAHILAAGGRVKAYVEDIAKKIPVQTLLNSVLDDFGRIDILVNCAEVEPQKTVLEMDDWDWQRTLDVNLSGAFLLTQSVGRIMKENGGGVIVQVGERAKGSECRAAYLTSKAGLAALSALAAYELSEFGIRVYHFQPEKRGDTVKQILELCC